MMSMTPPCDILKGSLSLYDIISFSNPSRSFWDFAEFALQEIRNNANSRPAIKLIDEGIFLMNNWH